MSLELVTPVEVLSHEQFETQEAVKLIRAGLDNLYEGLARFVTVEGWKVLGYSSFRQWAAQELAMSLSNASLHLAKTRKLMELSQILGRTVAELAPSITLRNVHRRPNWSPLVAQMKGAATRLAAVPALTTPDERKAAQRLYEHLGRLLA